MQRRLVALDGLRGIAAVGVLLNHVGIEFKLWWFPSGYLAVDFFFALSGFVVAQAYEPRLSAGMTFLAYARARLSRLWPMLVLGALLGLPIVLWGGRPAPIDPIAAFALQVAIIPVLIPRADIFLLNGVQWSLFFELFINAVHALTFRRIRPTKLVLIIGICFVLMVVAAWHFQTVSVGWGEHNFWAGFPRVGLSFFIGVGLSRLHSGGRLRLPAVWYPLICAALVAVLAHDTHRGGAGLLLNIAAVTLALPLLLALAVDARVPSWCTPIAQFLGNASYPLYAIHGVLLFWPLKWIRDSSPTPVTTLVALGYCAVVIAVAWLLDRYVDRPARSWLAGGSPSVQLATAK